MADESTHDELAGAAGSTRPTLLIRAPAEIPIQSCPADGRRPRNLEQYRAACEAADGNAVEEIDACGVRADMTIWYPDPAPGRWRPVKDWHVEGTKAVIDFLVAPPYSASWNVDADEPVCLRITPRQACHAVAG